MKNKPYLPFLLLVLSLLFLSCTSRTDIDQCEIFKISSDSIHKFNEVLKSVEIVPLDNINEAQIGKIDRVKTYNDFFLIGNKSDIIYIFKRDGTFVANSRKVFGKGNGEYYLCLAYSYNEYSHEIEIVVPDGMMFYDCNFKFLRKIKFEDKQTSSLLFNHLYDLAADKHMLMSPNDKEEPRYYFFDSKERKFVKNTAYPVDCMEITMQQQCISNNDFMAFPCMNYSFYTIDKNDYSFKQALTLDFGNKLSIDDYNDIDGIANRRKFLLECSKSLPLRTFRSDNYMASVVKEGQLREDLHLLILNLDSRRSTIVVSDQDGISLPIMDYFEDKTFYSFVTSDEISEYVKENLLDEKSKQIYTSISDSSNYCLLKYHFKDVL